MKILLDESVPRLVKRRLPELDISTVQKMGWSGTKNGDLLDLADAEFEVFVTSDKNLRYQQNLSRWSLGVIVLPSNRVPIGAQVLPRIREAIMSIQPGETTEIGNPK